MLLKVFTFATRQQIAEMERSLESDPGKREAQRFLADSLCTLAHGAEATEDAKRCAAVLFGGSLDGLSDSQLLDIFSDAPSTELSRDAASSMDLLTLLGQTVSSSKGEARRLIQGGGIYVDNERVSDPSAAVSSTRLLTKGFIILRSGKKNYHVVKIRD